MVKRLSSTDQNSRALINVPNPVDGGDAVNKTYVDGLPKGNAVTLFIASSTASAKVKAGADYVCDGIADQTEINAAIASLSSNGGVVTLSNGTFHISASISWATHGIHLVGQGQDATKIVNSTASANFDMIKVGNRQVDGIMRNSNTIEDLTVTHAGGASTKSCIWIDGGGRGGAVINVRTNEGFIGVRFTDLDRYSIQNLDANNPRNTAVLYEIGAEGTFGKVAMRDSSVNLSDTNSIGLRLDTLTSTNPFDSLVFENNLFFSTSNVTGTIGAQINIAALDTIFIGGQFESPSLAHVDINTSNDSRVMFKAVSFIQNGTLPTTSGIRLGGANHTIMVEGCVFQKMTNVFNGVTGYSSLELLGWNKNNGNVTNIFTGQFGLRHGTDTAFAGNGALYLGTDNERYENIFTNALRIVGQNPSSGKVWSATDGSGNGTWKTLAKADVGLANVDNTSDANKPVSTATQTALNSKQNTLVSGTSIKTINGQPLLGAGDIAVSGGGGVVDRITAGDIELKITPTNTGYPAGIVLRNKTDIGEYVSINAEGSMFINNNSADAAESSSATIAMEGASINLAASNGVGIESAAGFTISQGGLYEAKLVLQNFSANREFAFPNKSGIIALTSDIPSDLSFILSQGQDVALNNVSNNQVLTYDSSVAKWTNKTPSSGGSGITRSISKITSATTGAAAINTDYVYIISTGGSYTQPSAVGNTNTYTIKNTLATTASITTTSSQTVDGGTLTLGPSESVTLISDNSNWFII